MFNSQKFTIMRFTKTTAFLMVLLVFLNPLFANPDGFNYTREAAPEIYRWNTSAIYPSWDDWEKDLLKADELLKKMVSFRGKLGESPENFLELLNANDEAGKILRKLYSYPYLQNSVDTRDQEVLGRLQEVSGFYAGFATQTSWVTPEMLSIPEETIVAWINEYPAYKPYKFGIENAIRLQKYVLDNEKEELLSYFSLSTSAPSRIYTELSTSDMSFPEVTLSNGETIKATHANYSKVLAFNKNQDDRRKAWEAHFSAFEENSNTYAAILNAIYQGDWAYARSKNFDSYLQYSLIGDLIPEEVYYNLINTAKSNTEPLHRYFDLRRRAMKLESLNTYDFSIGLTDYSKQYTWEEASQLVLNALAPLGSDYQNRLKEMLAGGWIDVYEGSSKESNPYSMNVYGVHPYILMNWDGTLRDVFTLAHELGHALHSMYSSENQPFTTHRYSTFVAEVASIFNEELLLDYMLKHSDDPHEKIVLLNQAIANLSGTFYRQSLFADFEYQARTMVENGQSLNLATLSALMGDLNKTFYGETINDHPYRNVSWAGVMHFFQLKYYVFQYATSYAASSHLFQQIVNSPPEQQEVVLQKYHTLLKSGSSDYPINLLNAAGVDMSKATTLEAVVQRLDNLLIALERELIAVGMI
jgi:oligoendopeptidase F